MQVLAPVLLVAWQRSAPCQVLLRLSQHGRLLQFAMIVQRELRILARFRDHLPLP